MLTAGTVQYIAFTYLLMLVAYFWPQRRSWHMTIMALIIFSDVCFPLYLVLTKDWVRRLIDEEEIFSFLIWMHLILVISLYVLYFVQVQAARGILRGDPQARQEHKTQGLGILIVRALVLVTGALLVEPNATPGAH